MKKHTNIILYLLVSLLLTSSFFLSACEKKAEESEPIIKISDKRIFELFREMASIPKEGLHYPEKINQSISSKLRLWGLEPIIDDNGNIIVDIPASKGIKDAPLLVLECHTNARIVTDDNIIFNPEIDGATPVKSDDGSNIFSEGTSMGSSSTVGIVSLLSVLNYVNDIKNKDFMHGPIRALFTADDGTMNGSKNLHDKYLKDGDVLISFDNVNSGNVVLNSEYARQLNIYEGINSEESNARQAFAITAYNFPGYRFGEYSSAPNSAKIIADILTKANGAGILFELYGIESEKTNLSSSTETTAIVGLNEYELRRFRQIFNDTTEPLLNDIDSYYINNGLGITMNETLVPTAAIAQEDLSKILTQLFGFFNTNFSDSEGHNSGVFIENLSVTPQVFSADITVLADSIDAIETGTSKLQEISKLSGVSIITKSEIPGYSTDSENEFVFKYLDLYKGVIGAEAKIRHRNTANPIGFLAEKNPLMPILTIGVTIKDEGTVYESINSSSLSVPSNVILHYLDALIDENLMTE